MAKSLPGTNRIVMRPPPTIVTNVRRAAGYIQNLGGFWNFLGTARKSDAPRQHGEMAEHPILRSVNPAHQVRGRAWTGIGSKAPPIRPKAPPRKPVDKLTGDAKTQAEGKLEKAAGKVQNAAGSLKDSMRGK